MDLKVLKAVETLAAICEIDRIHNLRVDDLVSTFVRLGSSLMCIVC
jgi:hypothetical protein